MQGLATANETIQHNMTPPEGAVFTGETLPDGRLVYRRPKLLDKRSHVEPDRDPVSGKPMVWRNPNNGQPVRLITHRVIDYPLAGEPGPDGSIAEEDHPQSWEEFVLWPVGNNMTEIVTNFRPDPEEQKRVAEKQAREAFEGDLYRAMKEAGISPSALMDAVKASKRKKSEE